MKKPTYVKYFLKNIVHRFYERLSHQINTFATAKYHAGRVAFKRAKTALIPRGRLYRILSYVHLPAVIRVNEKEKGGIRLCAYGVSEPV